MSVAEEQAQDQERSEQPTQKRLRDARARGQIARSRELTMTIVMVAAAGIIFASGEWLVRSLAALLQGGLSIDPVSIRDGGSLLTGLTAAAEAGMTTLLPLIVLLPIAAVLGGIALGGLSFSTETLRPNFGKLNPWTGIKRIFGAQGLIELVKAVAKAGVVALCAVLVLRAMSGRIFALGVAAVPDALADLGRMLVTILLVCSASLGLIALVDVPYQLWSHAKRLRMTRKEVYDELKETEGRPEVKSRIRQMQQERANRRMLKAVPAADVVVTNPTHYAVALKYDDLKMRAPVVVAKGVDHMAAKIREIAAAHEVPIFESPILARSLYATTDVDREIDPRLYTAVAQVLTYIYQLRRARTQPVRWPDRPRINLTEELTREDRFSSRD
jgi:flagellar biosynthetic protein FlhB